MGFFLDFKSFHGLLKERGLLNILQQSFLPTALLFLNLSSTSLKILSKKDSFEDFITRGQRFKEQIQWCVANAYNTTDVQIYETAERFLRFVSAHPLRLGLRDSMVLPIESSASTPCSQRPQAYDTRKSNLIFSPSVVLEELFDVDDKKRSEKIQVIKNRVPRLSLNQNLPYDEITRRYLQGDTAQALLDKLFHDALQYFWESGLNRDELRSVMRILVEEGANPNSAFWDKTAGLWTPWRIVAEKGYKELIPFLSDLGARVPPRLAEIAMSSGASSVLLRDLTMWLSEVSSPEQMGFDTYVPVHQVAKKLDLPEEGFVPFEHRSDYDYNVLGEYFDYDEEGKPLSELHDVGFSEDFLQLPRREQTILLLNFIRGDTPLLPKPRRLKIATPILSKETLVYGPVGKVPFENLHKSVFVDFIYSLDKQQVIECLRILYEMGAPTRPAYMTESGPVALPFVDLDRYESLDKVSPYFYNAQSPNDVQNLYNSLLPQYMKQKPAAIE